MKEPLKKVPPRHDSRTREYWLKIAGRFSIASLTVVSLYVAFIAIAPFLISNTLVRSSMEHAVAAWTGHYATIEGPPEIQFWPEPRISLNKVTISRRQGSQITVLARVEKLSATFGFYDAIRGAPVFHDFHFLRPEIFLQRDAAGHLDWSDEGLLSAAVRDVTGEPSGTARKLPGERDAKIGTVSIEEGSVDIDDQRSGRHRLFSGITADIAWPRLSDAMKAYLIVRIGGQDARLDISTPDPLVLLGGSDAKTEVSFRSQALTGRFNGTANFSGAYFLSGQLDLNAPNIPALVAWTGAELPEMKRLKSGKLSAELTTVGGNLRFSDLRFGVNDTNANGILELARPPGAKPRLSGTLAFDKMDVGALLSAFSLHLPAGPQDAAQGENGLLRALDFDLSLSAGQAALEPFVLRDMAASILTQDGSAKFDIADAGFEGGRLTGHMGGFGSGFEDGGNLRISIRDADLQSIGTRLSLTGPLPKASGSLELSVSSHRPFWDTRLNDIEGTFQLHAQPGRLPGVSLQGISDLAAKRAYFKMSEGGTGGIDFDRIDIGAKFANGTAELEKAEIETRQALLSLAGVIPYATNSLALSARLNWLAPADDDAREPQRFFVGGSWPDPILSPILVGPARL